MSQFLSHERDSIVALATASGRGALAVVRVSGPDCDPILNRCFQSSQKTFESHRAVFGLWQDPESKTQIDEVLVLYFGEGRGFIGEKSFEIMCHGGPTVVKLVVESCLRAGARLARPGEFAFRAVMNGKMDLVQAESILDIIEAKTKRAASAALVNIRGALSERIHHVEKEIIFLLANLEASIDFTTEDIQPVDNIVMARRARDARDKIDDVLSSYLRGKVIKDGISVAIVGKPNSGKSSLLNLLVGEDRAIVTDIAGTTRDSIDVEKIMGGVLFRFVDTAGLRKSEDPIEKIGVSRAREIQAQSHFVIYLIDISVGVDNEDVENIKATSQEGTLIVFNKTDLLPSASREAKSNLQAFGLEGYPSLSLSVRHGAGVDELCGQLLRLSKIEELEEDRVLLTNLRQKQGLEAARTALLASIDLMEAKASPEFIVAELSEAHRQIEEVLGRAVRLDVMDRVFKEFCIGK